MFHTLRTKLALAFGLITILSIVVVGVGSLVLLREREVTAASQRTGDLLPPEVATVSMFASRGLAPDRIGGYLRQRADQLGVRFIMLDEDSNVLADTDGKLSGKFTALSAGKSGRNLPNSFRVTGYTEGSVRWRVFTQPSGAITLQGQRSVVPRQYNVMLLVPEKSITSAWIDLAPRLLIAGALALVASLAVALLVARSITRPLVKITGASEAMARGQYEQQIPVEGRDEVARLARSFNGMAVQVSHSHQMMRDLLANVAHELKTPLTSIQGFSQALADGALQSPEEYASAARIINEESARMRRLVNDLLYLSQIESGQAPLERQTIDPTLLLAAAEERIAWQLVSAGKQLQVDIAPALPSLNVDGPRIEQVLANLLDNAARYTPAGGTVTLRARPAESGGLRIDVRNSGSFIPDDQLERIFERFYQIDRSRRRNGRNGGLGLAIAREIIAAHNGRIAVESSEAAGTTFTVWLPSDSPAAASTATPARAVAIETRSPPAAVA